MEIITVICSAAALAGIILIIALLFGIKKSAERDNSVELKNEFIKNQRDIENLSKGIKGEFIGFRNDFDRNNQNFRNDISQGLEGINSRLEKMNKNNLEHEIQMNRLISNSLGDIREKNIEQNEKQTKVLEEALSKMRDNNEKKLDEMRATVSEKLDETLAKRLDSSFEAVSKQLENLYKSLGEMKELSTGVTDNVTALNRVLTNVKARGTWAEVQLKGILDQIIPGRYTENYSPAGKSGNVEFAVIIPSADGKQIYLPIDSKFPMEDYIRITEAADKADAEALANARKALSQRITNEAKDINSKYISVPETTPFAILYLATEGLYAEAVSLNSGLAETLHSKYNVMLAGPSTVTALLNSLAMGFKTIAVNEKAEEIRVMLTAVKSQYEKFGGLLEKASKKVAEAGKSLEEAKSRNSIIQKKLKKVESMDAAESDNLLYSDSIVDYAEE